ncbi:unnamed protein product [Anisakis simplex]|uniref:Neur_chan_memb domain-containing protein n=1 Tax=Anisakis simplex TaxID=6269 RepID=A0A0M3KCI0_ANISI|nr:unnamed protein product [Anisakis simplex]
MGNFKADEGRERKIGTLTTIFVFWIPPREHKITFSNSIFVALSFYYLILIDLIPPTSLVVPLLNKYLLFTLALVCASILISVVNVNIYRRQGTFYKMSDWMRCLFVRTLPKFLNLKMLTVQDADDHSSSSFLSHSDDSSEDSSCPTDSAIRKYTLPSFAEPITPKMRLLSLCEVSDVDDCRKTLDLLLHFSMRIVEGFEAFSVL